MGFEVSVGTANMVGSVLSTITYGFHLAIFVGINRVFYLESAKAKRRSGGLSRPDRWLFAYLCVLFSLATTGLCLQVWVNHDAFVVHQTFPGGPLAYLGQQARRPVNLIMTMVYIVLNWFVDGMLLYRTYVVFACSRYALVGCFIPLLGLIGMGTVFLRNIGDLGVNLWTDVTTAPSLTYLALSFSINVVLTVTIVGRLLHLRRYLMGYFNSRHCRVYTSVATMLIESAALYTIVALVSIVACATHSTLQNAALPMLGQLQAIPPLLIAIRVKEGRAMTTETWSTVSSFQVSSSQAQSFRGRNSKFTELAYSPTVTPSKPVLRVSTASESLSTVWGAPLDEKSSSLISVEDYCIDGASTMSPTQIYSESPRFPPTAFTPLRSANPSSPC